jgi:hypothetical protein
MLKTCGKLVENDWNIVEKLWKITRNEWKINFLLQNCISIHYRTFVRTLHPTTTKLPQCSTLHPTNPTITLSRTPPAYQKTLIFKNFTKLHRTLRNITKLC